jgi:hypothetical protein
LVDLLIELPLLVSATAVTRSLSGTTVGEIGDNGMLSMEFVH